MDGHLKNTFAHAQPISHSTHVLPCLKSFYKEGKKLTMICDLSRGFFVS